MQLSGEHNYLICDFELETGVFHISFLEEASLSSCEWGETTRLSPVWPIELSELTEELVEPKNDIKYVCFLGPVSPVDVVSELQTELLAKMPEGRAWLSVGFYNFVFLVSSIDELNILINFCHSLNCRMEYWDVIGPSDRGDFCCDDVHFIDGQPLDQTTELRGKINGNRLAVKNLPAAIDASIKQAFIELQSLAITTHARSHSKFKSLSQDLEELENYIPALEDVLVESDSDQSQDRQKRNLQALRYRDNILNVNAGLSRMVSQVYSGTSPIHQSECHAWPHSLLGLGTAILALRNLTSFVFEELNNLRINALYFQNLESPFEFKDQDEKKVDISTISEIQPRLYKSGLTFPQKLQEKTRHADDDQIPNPITYYSGRDGFRYGTFTQSAPLLSVHGCNSSQWTLGTISHEISHRFLSPKLHILFDDLQSSLKSTGSQELETFAKSKASTKRDASLKLLLLALVTLEGERLRKSNLKIAMQNTTEFVKNAISFHKREIEEKLVHIFDFVHFYNSDPEAYVTSVWRSWAVQPSISNNFEKYIFRTAAALSTLNFHEKNWIELTSSRLSTIAAKHSLNSHAMSGQDIKNYLDTHTEEFRSRMRIMTPIISLFYTLFHYPDLGPRLAHDGRDTTNAKWLVLYDDSGTRFPKLENPLRFARDMAREATANEAKSAWLLTALAYRCSSTGDE